MRLKLRQDSILRRPWLVAAMVVALGSALVIMIYSKYCDIEPYTAWSVELLDCIFRKTTTEFYEYTLLQTRSEDPMVICCDKTIPMLLPIAIWNIPTWIIHEITGQMKVTGFWDYTWMKMGYLLCVLVVANESKKIVKIVNPQADYLLVYPLVIGSFDVINSTMYASEDEIIYLMTLVITARFLLEKRDRLFLAFAGITVALNPLMIIPVILLLLIYQKKLLLLLDLVIVYLPSGLFNLVYRNNEVYHSHTLMQDGLMQTLFQGDIAFSQSEGNVSLFLVVTCVLAFYSYCLQKEKFKPFDLVFIMSIEMTAMTLLSSGGLLNFFYRSLLYVPFMVVLIISNQTNININMMLFFLFSWGRGWLDVLNCPLQNLSSPYLTINNDFTRRVFDKSRIVSPSLFVSRNYPALSNWGLVSALCLSLAIVIYFINYGKHRQKEIKSFEIPKDILALGVVLFTPAMIGLFVFAMVKSDVYDKTILFGSEQVMQYYEEAVGYDYHDSGHIFEFSHNIIYEDSICLMGGEDREGVRYLYQEGTSFGPYIKLFPGEYRVTINGSGLDNIYYDCIYNDSDSLITIPIEPVVVSGKRLEYTINIDQYTENVELRFMNYSSEEAMLSNIHIQEIG